MRLLLIATFISTLSCCRQTYKTVEFEKIVFHSSVCFGSCSTYHLQLDSNKNIKLLAEKVYKTDAKPFTINLDSSKIGYFIGQANDTLFENLLNALQNIGLDTINFSGPMYTDGPEITLIIYYNGKRRFLQSSFPTPKADQLISILYQICKQSSLSRTEEKFVIEN